MRASRRCTATKASETPPPVTLLVAPTGSRKSTLMRAAAVQYVTEQPDKTVVILMPRHKLGDEQIDAAAQGAPRAAITTPRCGVGGMPGTRHVGNGREQKMCQRAEEAAAVEKAMLDVERSLCKHGRGGQSSQMPVLRYMRLPAAEADQGQHLVRRARMCSARNAEGVR